MEAFTQRLQWFNEAAVTDTLKGIRRGLEKEALRISTEGKLAQTPHPQTLGSALTHPHITTDFSEALLEFITPPCESIDSAFEWLDDIHRYACHAIDASREMLWMASMPCILEGDDAIPVAQYGSSNVARMKKVYRIGLGHRYGRVMQTISGIHYNFSLPDTFWEKLYKQEVGNDLGRESMQDFKTRRYFDLIRNYRRYFWLLLYCFGAAPAVCRTFVKGRKHKLDLLGDHSYHYPYATSLRMGELGYQSKAQAELHVDYNSLQGYIHSLLKGLTTSHADYEEIGVCKDGEYLQLNANVLQIENEFYSTIRPKRVTESGETPIRALHERGVEYIEVRSVDVDPFSPLGIDKQQACFIELFLMFCLLKESPPTDETEYQQIAENQHRVVNQGRDPQLEIYCHGNLLSLRRCGEKLLSEIAELAGAFDKAYQSDCYSNAIEPQKQKLADATLTSSGKIMQYMEQHDVSFFRFAIEQSKQHSEYFSQQSLSEERQQYFHAENESSHRRQKEIEAQSEGSFEAYLSSYFEQYQL